MYETFILSSLTAYMYISDQQNFVTQHKLTILQ